MSPEEIDKHLDAILRASGSSLRHYTMQKSLDDMRAALRSALSQAEADRVNGERYRALRDHISSDDWRSICWTSESSSDQDKWVDEQIARLTKAVKTEG